MQKEIGAVKLISFIEQDITTTRNHQMKIYSISTKALLIIVLAISLFGVSCGEENKEEPGVENVEIGPAPGSDSISPDASYTDTVHTSQNSIDYAGIYKGVTPCADCEGIETELTLNTDSTFVLSQKYLGMGEDAQGLRVGRYQWINDGIIELIGISDGAGLFKVGEGKIWQLDMNGKVIEGALANKYILIKS
jgi:uncharacterized lipoprotein NlpE involved in copper resistance